MDDDSAYDPEFHVPSARECDAIEKYLEIETEFMAVENFYSNSTNVEIREFAVAMIAKHSTGVDPDSYVPYLAMNYFDRYFSRNLVPDGREDVFNQTRVLAICCLTIASKMRTKSFSVDQFLKDRFVDDISHQQILQMELRILNGLQWRMRPVTPFCYLDYYYFPFKQFGGFKRRCINEIIVQSQGVTFSTRYKPSRIALSSFLAATSKVYADKFEKLETPDEVEACMKEMMTLCTELKIEVQPQSKIGSSSSAPEVRKSEPIPIPETKSTEGIPHWPPETESDPLQQRPGKTVDSETSEVWDKDKGKSSLDDEMMFPMSMSEGESEKQRQSNGNAVAEETSGDDPPSETESERQRQAAKGKAPVEETSGDDVAVLEEIFEKTVEAGLLEQKTQAKGKAVVVAEKNEDAKVAGTISEIVPASEAAPKRLMNFDLRWPTDTKPPDQPIDPSLLVKIPERGPAATPPTPNKGCFNVCGRNTG